MNNFTINEEIWRERKVLAINSTNLSVRIDMADGMNVVSVMYKNIERIYYNNERYEKGHTYCIPILYPTPNRVKNGTFSFENTRCNCPMHGLVRKTLFTEINRICSKKSASITGEVRFENSSALYEQFPFKSRLQIQISVTENTVTWKYTIINDGEKTLPYGFAVHPFFERQPNTLIKTNADYIMNTNEEKIPDGILAAVSGTKYDVSDFTLVQNLTLDTVYYKKTKRGKPLFAEIRYPHEKLSVRIKSSAESNHLVLFMAPEGDFFCIEPQTCSTDCHNLYANGFKEESNLLFVPSGKAKKGWSKISFGTY